jgi:hypothetical protein
LPPSGNNSKLLRGDVTWSSSIRVPDGVPFTWFGDNLSSFHGTPNGTYANISNFSTDYDGLGRHPISMNIGPKTSFGPFGSYSGIGSVWTSQNWMLSTSAPSTYEVFTYGATKSDYVIALTGYGTFWAPIVFGSGGVAAINFTTCGVAVVDIQDTSNQTVTLTFPGIKDYVAARPEQRTFRLFVNDSLGGSTIATTWTLVASDGRTVTDTYSALPSSVKGGTFLDILLVPSAGNYNIFVVQSGIASTTYTDGQARAAVGSNVINTATVHLTYSGGPQTIAASIPNGGINASALFANGVVPVSAIAASGSPGSGNYLRGDGSWAVPAGGGGGGQAAIQFGNQGIGIGAAGAITGVNFAGAGVTSSAVGTQVTVNIPGAPNGTNNVFNVAQAPYNADKTGAVSCNTAVANAYAAAVAAGGGTVYFPAGTYLVTSTLSFNSNVNILGDGCSTISAGYNAFADAPTSASTVLRWGGSPGGRLMRFPTAINGIRVGGFHLISPTVNQCGTGIEINSASNCRFSNISGASFGQYGFRMNATGTSGNDAIQMCTVENLSFQMYNDGMALQGIPIWLGAQNSSAGLSDVTRCVFINCNVTHQNIGFYIGFADGNVFIGCGSNHVYAPTFRTDAYDNNYDFVLDSQDSIGGFSGPNIFYHPLGTFRALASSRPGFGPKAYIVGTQCGGDLVFPPKVDGNLASNSWVNWQFFNFDYRNGAPFSYGFRFPQMSFGTAITYGLGVPASDGQMPGLLMYSGEQPNGATDTGEFRFHGASLGTTPQAPKRLLSTAVG